MTRLVILRPEPGATASVERARAAGLDALACPLFTVEPLDWDVPDPAGFDALLLTSANAVRHGGPRLGPLRGLPVHAVGDATAAAARARGFAVASVGNGGVGALLAALEPRCKLLHLCGADRTDVAERQAVTAVPVYIAKPIAEPRLDALEGQVAAVHSPRAGARLAELIDGERRSTISIAAISQAAATAAGGGWAKVEAAAEPTDGALLALAARLCDKPGR